MTEAEWHACTDLEPMLAFLRGKGSGRKLRLFAVACCRRIWAYVTDQGSRAIVEIVERSADNSVDAEEILALDYDRLTDDCGGEDEPFRSAFMVAGHVGYSIIGAVHGSPFRTDDWADARSTAEKSANAVALSLHKPGDSEKLAVIQSRVAVEQAEQCKMLRCIFGNPLRPATIDPQHLTANVNALAQAIYDDRAFDRLPILADALEDAGCTDPDILAHCRGPGPHVRGCWVVDLLTGRE